jgi:hypothetical protein
MGESLKQWRFQAEKILELCCRNNEFSAGSKSKVSKIHLTLISD